MEKCYICKDNPGEVRCVIIVKGEKIIQYLCQDCARKAGIAEQAKFNRKAKNSSIKFKAEKQDIFCSNCKLSFSQFLRTGLFGCPQCYSAFERFIADILKGIHSATYHKGRGPGKERTFDLVQLKWKLSEAVIEENFEKAAELRDEIFKLQKDSN
ncbi:UvrB/UvrC motif-containing protein [bacterium]|nr:UvrB/UvrC motif-containing protein [bacterium]